MKQKVERGGWPWQAPTGYLNRRDKNRAWVEADPVMGPLITRAFEEMATGKWTLAAWTRHAVGQGYRSRKGQPLTKSAWHRIFHNRFYLGKTWWGPADERDGDHPALTDAITFQRVQEVLAVHGHHRRPVRRHSYLLKGLLYSLDANSFCTGCTQVDKGQAYYRSTARINGRQVYYNSREVDAQVEEIVKGLEIAPETRPVMQQALTDWLLEMTGSGEGSDLQRSRARLEQLQRKRKNLNRMAAEDMVSWEEFKELRAEIEAEEAALSSRIQMVMQHQTLLAADFELALDIASNLGWLYGRGNFDERRLLVETLFKQVNVRGDSVVAYELNPPFNMFYPGSDNNENGPEGPTPGPVRVSSTMVGHLEGKLQEQPAVRHLNEHLPLSEEPPGVPLEGVAQVDGDGQTRRPLPQPRCRSNSPHHHHHRLLHATRRHALSRPRRCLLRPARQAGRGPTVHPSPGTLGLYRNPEHSLSRRFHGKSVWSNGRVPPWRKRFAPCEEHALPPLRLLAGDNSPCYL
jgi:hypothetical protein